MITSATTVNTVYGQSAVNSTTNNKADGASFAAAFANASNTPAKTTSTASADKVTISAQAQQVSAQDDIEAEAQSRFTAMMEGKKSNLNGWYPYIVPFGDDQHNFTNDPSNIQLSKDLEAKYKEYASQHNDKASEILDQMTTLSVIQQRKVISPEELPKETAIHKRVLELMGEDMDKNGLNVGTKYQKNLNESSVVLQTRITQNSTSGVENLKGALSTVQNESDYMFSNLINMLRINKGNSL